ncbi:FkbM family methyltransferase [Streptomyces dangxiongensis]|uniref:FkbM family methyltransferase n=1 Tax=Streptomyces dangxiongensis TaxID=1442032 RepID=A0A3G2JG31_9ACTN|nr:FkbM family methyltransferase [Streptomyces dangxiongensis]AYN40325.1 FkbM family methyltransferase [Streptomyces dangxiongensis]
MGAPTPPRLTEVADGFHVHSASSLDARFLYREIFEGGTYARVDLPEEPFVIDVGANIGLFTLFVKQRRPKAEVLAFEPLPDLVAALRANAGRFALDRVAVHERALGAEDRDGVEFTYYPLLPSSSTLFPQDQGQLRELLGRSFPPRVVERMFRGRRVSVRVDRLTPYLDGGRSVDLLKIDAVGSELAVLRGVEERLWPLLRSVFIDVQDVGGRVAEVCRLLRTMGLDPAVHEPPASGGDGLNYVIHAVRP